MSSVASTPSSPAAPASRFAIGDTDFLLDGAPHRIISGALHYFRVHPDLWADRIHKAKLMGLNTIETYVAWNAHEPRPGEWDETGGNDLGRFLDLIASEGMHAIVRPGPYICAEWHNGGLPAWLTADTSLRLRTSDPAYVAALTDYLHRVNAIIAPRQIDQGGPVILVQIENEYGAYAADKAYLAELAAVTRADGITVPFVTVDQPIEEFLANGSIDGIHKTGSFGSRIAERLATLRVHQPTGPLMCMEFWCGWFDHWGEKHHTTAIADAAADLDALLAAGASVNIYMFHGGTNFALTAGANDEGRYLPMVTSYDYDAPLSESGEITDKFRAFRDVIARYAPVPDETLGEPVDAPELSTALSAVGSLADIAADAPTQVFAAPPTLDELGPDVALALYSTSLAGSAADADGGSLTRTVLDADAIRDIAWVGVDSAPVGVLGRSLEERSLTVPSGRTLQLLVEETGRVNYGIHIGEAKGVIGTPRIDGVPLPHPWDVTAIDVAGLGARVLDRAGEQTSGGPVAGPVGLRGEFDLAAPADLFLDTAGWGKGYVWINGFFLGRYWRRGPQRTLYVPAPATRAGANTIAIVELESMIASTARFLARPDFGHEAE